MTYGFNIAPHTFFNKVRQVLPGHFMVIQSRGIKTQAYWDIDMQSPIIDPGGEELACLFRQRFEQTVQASLVSDVPVAAYLSGGIDSSAVTGMYANLSNKPIKTITITFDDAGYEESAYSQKVSECFRTENIEFNCRIEPSDIKNLIYYLENPLVSLLNLPLFLLSKKTKQMGIKVVLTGDGADEVIGGYDYFKLLKALAFIERTESLFRKNILRRIYSNLRTPSDAEAQFIHLKNFSDHFPVSHSALPYKFQEFQLKDQLYSPEFKSRLQKTPMDNPFFFNLEKISHRSLIDQALYIETKMRLLNLTLPLSDKMSMANSVEVRPLFLDHEFVNFMFRIPHHYKIQGLSEKHILKKSMQNLLPAEVCIRRKQPLQPPGKWFIQTAGDMLRDYLSHEKIKQTGYFNPAFVDFILEEYNQNSKLDYSGVIVVVFFIQLWHDIFLNQH
jgi:asparagine synthase (glutamine-hydrolysing)